MSKWYRADALTSPPGKRAAVKWADGAAHGDVRFIAENDAFVSELFAMLDTAVREIDVEFYIVEDDEFGARLMDALERAAGRGVTVKMMVDGFGSLGWLQRKVSHLVTSPLDVRIYNPVPWSPATWRPGLRALLDMVRRFTTFNRRDHRKLVVVDGERAVLGSHNVWDASLQWQEAGLVLTGSHAGAIRDSFERVWARTFDLRGRRRPLARRLLQARRRAGWDQTGILDNTTLGSSRARSRAIISLVRRARQRLWITTPYLYPHRTLLRLIKARARAGVDVRLILPRRCDVPISRWMAQSLYGDLLHSGVAIHELAEGVLHAKVMVADDAFLVGSSNLNHRSFLQDLEIDFLGRDPAVLVQIVEWKRRTMDRCEQVNNMEQVHLHWLKRCVASLLRPFKGYF